MPRAVGRELFVELAGREWLRARRYGSGAALLLVAYEPQPAPRGARGTAAAEALLAMLLAQTAQRLRGADMLTRWAPACLAVFLTPSDATGALDVAERIREGAEQLELPGEPQPLRGVATIGVAHLRAAHLNLQALLDDAHDALGAAREAGGNCVRAAPLAQRSPPIPGPIDGRRARRK